MSFYNKSSLLTIPTAYKQGKLYSAKPTDGSGDFTFTRSTSATRVNEAGLIEKERENLLLYSNDFSQWINLYSTETGGQVGYDGSNDAWLLTDSASNLTNYRIFIPVNQNGIYTFSVYAKAGTKDIVYLKSYINNNNIGYFDLTNGTVLTTINCIDSKIESIGNGWYRCSIVFNQPNDYVTIGMAETTVQSYVGDGTGTIYIQDAQLEAGLVATDYIETTTSTVATGITTNVPRIDYSSGTPSLLLEPQRTNLITNSEVFVAIGSATVVTNADISPDGFNNASKVTFGTSVNEGCFFSSSGTCNPNTVYTCSGYVKNVSGNGYYSLRIDTDTTSLLVNENFYATNQWTRFTHTFTTDASATSFLDGRLRPSAAGAGNEILIYGFQLEEGSYATSYIPTYGTSVTRTIDDCFLTNAQDLIGQTEGTLYCEFLKSDDSAYTIVEINLNDSTNNRLMIYVEAFNTRIQILLVTGGVQQFNDYFQYPISNRNKIALTYTNNNFKLFVNGSLEWTSTSGTLGSSYNYVALRDNNLSSRQSKTVNVITFPTILTDAECITLTTI